MNKTITIDQVNGNISVSVKVVSPFTQEVTITNNDEGTTWSKAVSAYHGECFVTAAKELAANGWDLDNGDLTEAWNTIYNDMNDVPEECMLVDWAG